MNPADKIERLIAEIKALKEERGYSLARFKELNEELHKMGGQYHWKQDAFLDVVNKKNKLFRYRNINAEIKKLREILKLIKSLLKKKDFAHSVSLVADVGQVKKAIDMDLLWLDDASSHAKDCRVKARKFVKVIKTGTSRADFDSALSEWDNAQIDLTHLDKLEEVLISKAIEFGHRYPKKGLGRLVWQKAAVYSIAALIGFGALTGTFSQGQVNFGNVAMAGEVQQAEGDFKTRDELMTAVSKMDLVKTINKDMIKKVPGDETVLEYYKSGKNIIVVFKLNNIPYGYMYASGKLRINKIDKNNTKKFEIIKSDSGKVSFDINLEKYLE